MPRKDRKSDASAAPPSPPAAPADHDDAHDKHKDKDATTIDDLSLPKSIIARLAKGVLPPNTQIQANAILAMSKSTTVFVNYLAAHANANTLAAGKRTIAPADVFKALDDVEFGFFRERLEAEFNKFNAIQTDKRNNYRTKKAAPADAAAPGTDTTTASATDAADPAHRSKKARVEPIDRPDEDADDADDAPDDHDEHVEDDDEEEEEEEEEDEAEAEEEHDQDKDDTQDQERHRDEALDGDESD